MKRKLNKLKSREPVLDLDLVKEGNLNIPGLNKDSPSKGSKGVRVTPNKRKLISIVANKSEGRIGRKSFDNPASLVNNWLTQQRSVASKALLAS